MATIRASQLKDFFMFKKSPIVRSADIGYGHVKWTEGRDSDGNIIADSFASLAPLAVVD